MSIDLDFELNADRLREECGVFGIYGHPDAAALTALGLHALQHRFTQVQSADRLGRAGPRQEVTGEIPPPAVDQHSGCLLQIRQSRGVSNT